MHNINSKPTQINTLTTTNKFTRQLYKIGAVSQTTGIPVSTLRIWEKRYQAFSPIKTPGNHRMFDENDVLKALLLKKLLQEGHAISAIAGIALDQLQQFSGRLTQRKNGLKSTFENSTIFLAVVGLGMANRIESNKFKLFFTNNVFKISHVFADIDDALNGDMPDHPRVLLVKANSLQPPIQKTLLEIKKKNIFDHTIVVYNFATENMVQQLKFADIVVRREPVSDTELADLLQSVSFEKAAPAQLFVKTGSDITARKFSETTLNRVSSISTNVLCECPRHVAELISQLSSFEEYSQDCMNKTPQDARLHAYLQSISGTARCLFENALEKIAMHEGIDLNERSA